MPVQPRRVHFVLSSHWDREWYQTFQDFRFQLVKVFDDVFDALERGELLGPFVTDGQAILIEDYLEIRPEKRETVRRYLRQGKLKAGPWYVMPDEFIVSGEALVRNLELGRELVRSWGGEPSSAGFVCDVFGHNSQLPQIFNGFRIPFVYLWRGTNLIDSRHFRWRGADGTEILGYRFGPRGYCDYAFRVRHASDPCQPLDPEKKGIDLQDYLSDEAGRTQINPLLAFDGGDHLAWDAHSYALIAKRIREPDDSLVFVHSSLDDYQAEVLAQEQHITACLEGELREPGLYPSTRDHQEVIPGVLSSRIWIKQENAACQAALCQWAEPLDVLASVLAPHPGRDRAFLNSAWKWLLQNHPHDSICGCSIDAVHEDMRYRFAQSRQIAERLTQEKMRQIASAIEGELRGQELRVVVFNPLPQPSHQPTEITLDFPQEWPRSQDWFSPESFPLFRLYDTEGHEIEYQRVSVDPNHTRLERFDQYLPKGRKVTSVTLSLPLAIPAMGYSSLIVRPETDNLQPRFPTKPSLKLNDRTIANETLRVEVELDGTLALTDLRTGRRYPHLMSFEDGADIGNGYNYRAPASDQVNSSMGTQVEVATLHDGPFKVTLRVRRCMSIPAEFDFHSMQRSFHTVDVQVDSLITLRTGGETLEVETTILNTAKDHRMRVVFPSGASNATTYFTDTPFDVVERPIDQSSSARPYREEDPLTRPQQSWAVVCDDPCGLAVVAPGQMEVTVQDLPERPIALTLFRSTGNTVLTDGEPGGQLLGPLTFRYCLSPVRGSPDRAALCQLGQRLITGLKYVQLSGADLDKSQASRRVPPSLGFLNVTGQVVVTSVRQMEDDWEVRLFNPNITTVSATLELLKNHPDWDAPEYAQLVDLEHRPITKIHRIRNRTVEYQVAPKKILTVRFSRSNTKDEMS